MKRHLSLAIGMALSLTACQPSSQFNSQTQPEKLNTSKSSDFWSSLLNLQTQPVVTVIAANGAPIFGAKVLIGTSANDPFAGNIVTTNELGQASLPKEWTQELPVTVDAPGFIKVTYLNQAPQALNFTLAPLKKLVATEIKGRVRGLPVSNGDNQIDFGLVIPAFTKLGLMAFDINSVISPITDQIKVLGQEINLPANVSVPSQSERYALFNINLDKPVYRLYLDQPGVNRIYAARGRFPFRDVVDQMRNNVEFYELINYFKINGGTMKDLDLMVGSNSVDLNASELNFTEKKSIKSQAIKSDEIFLAVAVAEDSGYLVPTDIKKLKGNSSVSLATLPNAKQKVVAAIKRAEELKTNNDRISATILPFENGMNPSVLNLIADPQYKDGVLRAAPPEMVEGVNPIGTLAVLSLETEILQDGKKIKVMVPVWQMMISGWVTEVVVPALQIPEGVQKQKWDINYLGSTTSNASMMGAELIEATTHVTHSSVIY